MVIAIIIFCVLVSGAIWLWFWIAGKAEKNKVEIFKKKVLKAEKKKGSPLTKEEKEIIAKEVDDIGAFHGDAHIDIHSLDWRFDVNDEDVTYRKPENKNKES
jgi:hypothetical protein